MIAEVSGNIFVNWIKTKGYNYFKSFMVFCFVIFILLSLVDVVTGASKSKQQYNGLIMTDKQGRSYMVRQTIFGTFKINEFDVNKMRLIE